MPGIELSDIAKALGLREETGPEDIYDQIRFLFSADLLRVSKRDTRHKPSSC